MSRQRVGRSSAVATRLAAVYGVSARTIERDGQFAAAVDRVTSVMPDIEQRIWAGTSPSKAAVIRAARLLPHDPGAARALLQGDVPATVKAPIAQLEQALRRAFVVDPAGVRELLGSIFLADTRSAGDPR